MMLDRTFDRMLLRVTRGEIIYHTFHEIGNFSDILFLSLLRLTINLCQAIKIVR